MSGKWNKRVISLRKGPWPELSVDLKANTDNLHFAYFTIYTTHYNRNMENQVERYEEWSQEDLNQRIFALY